MLKALTRREIVRTSAKSSDDQPNKYRYGNCITLEPPFAESAWTTLSEDTFGLEIADYPRILHNAFIIHLRKRAENAENGNF